MPKPNWTKRFQCRDGKWSFLGLSTGKWLSMPIIDMHCSYPAGINTYLETCWRRGDGLGCGEINLIPAWQKLIVKIKPGNSTTFLKDNELHIVIDKIQGKKFPAFGLEGHDYCRH